MINTFGLSIIRIAQRLSITLTLCSLIYVAYFFFSNNHNPSFIDDRNNISPQNINISSPNIFDIKPFNATENTQARDIFSLTQNNNLSTAVENTPKGQLPD